MMMMMLSTCSRSNSRRTVHLSLLIRSRAAAAAAGRRIISVESPTVAITGGRSVIVGVMDSTIITPISTTRSCLNDATISHSTSSTFRFDNDECNFHDRLSTTVRRRQQHDGHSSLLFLPHHHHTCQHQKQQQNFQHQQRACFSSQVFVSRHNQSFHRTVEEILDFLDRQGIATIGHRITSTHIILKECPFCEKPTNDKTDNCHKCYIQKESGAFFCHRCGTGGSWFDLKKILGNFELSHQSSSSQSQHQQQALSQQSHKMTSSSSRTNAKNNYKGSATQQQPSSQYGGYGGAYARKGPITMKSSRGNDSNVPGLPMPSQRLQALYSSQLLDGHLRNNTDNNDTLDASSSTTSSPSLEATTSTAQATASQDALRYLTETRGLSVATLRKYGVGLGLYSFYNDSNQWINAVCVTFPWLLSVADIQEQEHLRGGTFDWQPPPSTTTVTAAPAAADDNIDDLAATAVADVVVTNKGKNNKKQKSKKVTADAKNNAKMKENSSGTSKAEMLKKCTFLTRRIKARAIHNKKHQRLDPPGGGWGLFGFHTVPNNNNDDDSNNKNDKDDDQEQQLSPATTTIAELVLTEGEYDAMAVYQATGRPAVSLPNGCRSLPVEVLPLLERFDKIYLWMDNDGPGQEGAELFAKKIGMERCFIVRPTLNNVVRVNGKNKQQQHHDNYNGGGGGGSSSTFDGDDYDDDEDDDGDSLALPKDANEALLMGLDLEAIIKDARLIPHERIATFASMRSEVMHEIRFPEKYVGTPMSSLPALTNIIKGFRRGEMTVLTGPTGSGKTTFLSQQSIDLAEQGINVLWGSFEIKNSRLIKKLLQQFAREPIEVQDCKKLDAIADRFEQLPLHFMKFHGGTDVDDVLDAMDYAVYVNDVQHIILDNMQFMISRTNSRRGGGDGSSFDKFDVQDVAVEKFRKFATDRNVHITLVVHPRKQQESVKLSIDSIYGSAKATQEADTVMILQVEPGGKKYVEVKKNRFNGDLGYVNLHFDRHSGRYADKPIVIPATAGKLSSSNSSKVHSSSVGGGTFNGKPVAASSAGGVWDEMFGSN